MSNSTNNIQVQTSFNYEVLEVENRSVVQERTKEIKERLRRAAQDIWEIGKKLVEVRSQLKHGQFEVWLKAEFGWSRRTAYNFISVYEAFAKSANFAQINIAASALYLLAAPSVPQNTRDEFLQRAQAGEKLTYDSVRKTIKEMKPQAASVHTPIKPLDSPISQLEIVALIPAPKVEAKEQVVETHELELSLTSPAVTSNISIQPGWYSLEKLHVLFYGDTASPQFFKHVPQAALALAVTSDDWDHDWLVDSARTVIILQESALKEKLIEQLILMFSTRGETVVFPWLPSGEIIALAHKLERQIYAGDSDSERCIEAIRKSGLRYERIYL